MDPDTIAGLIQALKPYPGLLSSFLGMLTGEESRYAVQILGLLDGETLFESEADQNTRSHPASLAAAHYYVQPGPGYPGI